MGYRREEGIKEKNGKSGDRGMGRARRGWWTVEKKEKRGGRTSTTRVHTGKVVSGNERVDANKSGSLADERGKNTSGRMTRETAEVPP